MISLDRVGVGARVPVGSADDTDPIQRQLLAAARRAGVPATPIPASAAATTGRSSGPGCPGARLGSARPTRPTTRRRRASVVSSPPSSSGWAGWSWPGWRRADRSASEPGARAQRRAVGAEGGGVRAHDAARKPVGADPCRCPRGAITRSAARPAGRWPDGQVSTPVATWLPRRGCTTRSSRVRRPRSRAPAGRLPGAGARGCRRPRPRRSRPARPPGALVGARAALPLDAPVQVDDDHVGGAVGIRRRRAGAGAGRRRRRCRGSRRWRPSVRSGPPWGRSATEAPMVATRVPRTSVQAGAKASSALRPIPTTVSDGSPARAARSPRTCLPAGRGRSRAHGCWPWSPRRPRPRRARGTRRAGPGRRTACRVGSAADADRGLQVDDREVGGRQGRRTGARAVAGSRSRSRSAPSKWTSPATAI